MGSGVREKDGSDVKWRICTGRKKWDNIRIDIGNKVSGVFIINFLAWFALVLGDWLAWRLNRKKKEVELIPTKKL